MLLLVSFWIEIEDVKSHPRDISRYQVTSATLNVTIWPSTGSDRQWCAVSCDAVNTRVYNLHGRRRQRWVVTSLTPATPLAQPGQLSSLIGPGPGSRNSNNLQQPPQISVSVGCLLLRISNNNQLSLLLTLVLLLLLWSWLSECLAKQIGKGWNINKDK